MTHFRRTTLLVGVLFLLGTEAAHADEKPTITPSAATPVAVRQSVSRGWLIQETRNFRIFCKRELNVASKLPTACEELRAHLGETWFGESASDWQVVCDVVVHETTASYVAALGSGSEQSSGCASFEIDAGKIVRRRIDLRATADDWFDSSLPHELTHVVLAERFTRNRIPRWADEGMAILVEPAEKQRRRREALERGLADKKGFTARELTGLIDYPASDRREAFYGQSASLVSFLMERESPEKFLEFLEIAATGNRLAALKEVYGFSDWQALEAAWHPRLMLRGESAELLAQRVGRITATREID